MEKITCASLIHCVESQSCGIERMVAQALDFNLNGVGYGGSSVKLSTFTLRFLYGSQQI